LIAVAYARYYDSYEYDSSSYESDESYEDTGGIYTKFKSGALQAVATRGSKSI